MLLIKKNPVGLHVDNPSKKKNIKKIRDNSPLKDI